MVQRISIIGAGGKMGSWFLNYFLRKPATKVLVYDVKTLSKLPANVTQCVSVASCVKDADLGTSVRSHYSGSICRKAMCFKNEIRRYTGRDLLN